MIDIVYHVSARGRGHVPDDAHDALDTAVAGERVSPDLLDRWHHMIGLLNRLVHGYQKVDDTRLIEELRAGIGDFRTFAALVARWLDTA